MRKIIDKVSRYSSDYQVRNLGSKRILIYGRSRSVFATLEDLDKGVHESYLKLLSFLNDSVLKSCPFCEFVGELTRICKCIGINENREEAISILESDSFYIKNFERISTNGYIAFYDAYYNTSGMSNVRGFYSDSKFDVINQAVDYFFESLGSEINSRNLGDKSFFRRQLNATDHFSIYVGVNSVSITIFKIVRTN